MGECLIFVKQIKQSEADVTEFWKREKQEQGEKEREGEEKAEFMTGGSSNLLRGA